MVATACRLDATSTSNQRNKQMLRWSPRWVQKEGPGLLLALLFAAYEFPVPADSRFPFLLYSQASVMQMDSRVRPIGGGVIPCFFIRSRSN